MKHSNQLEERLRFWTPRAPSPKVRAALFGEAVSAPGASAFAHGQPAAWHWLAPAMAVFLFGMFLMGREPVNWLGAGGSRPFFSESMIQPQLAAFSPNTHHSEANSPPASCLEVVRVDSSLESTNDGAPLSTPREMARTNSLFQ